MEAIVLCLLWNKCIYSA